MHILIAVLIALLGILQYRLWVGEGSLAEVHALKQEIAARQVEIARLQQRNHALHAEVEDLREGLEALEERARDELGMIRPGEVFIQVIERSPDEAPAPAPPTPAAPPPAGGVR